jgi:hypothetical protein
MRILWLDTWGYKHTLRILNTSCFSTAINVMQTRRTVMFMRTLRVTLLVWVSAVGIRSWRKWTVNSQFGIVAADRTLDCIVWCGVSTVVHTSLFCQIVMIFIARSTLCCVLPMYCRSACKMDTRETEWRIPFFGMCDRNNVRELEKRVLFNEAVIC